MTDRMFLPGVPFEHVFDLLAKAGGNEFASGKLASPESSAALAVDTFAGSLSDRRCCRLSSDWTPIIRQLPSMSNIAPASRGPAAAILGSTHR